MPKFVFAYHGGKKFNSKEEGQQHMVAWRKWVADLGEAMADPGMAVGQSTTVSAAGAEPNGGANPISGVSVINAPSLDDAIKMAKACPHLAIGGSIEIAEAMQM